jgi:hypothetical protein
LFSPPSTGRAEEEEKLDSETAEANGSCSAISGEELKKRRKEIENKNEVRKC